MRFMIMVRATKETESGLFPPDVDQLFADMAAYHEDLAKAGVLLEGSGLQPSAKGFRIRYSGDKRTVMDGPFAETKELIAGYTIIKVKSRTEALDWAKRMPNPFGKSGQGEIEVRQLYELEDFDQGESIERLRKIGIGGE